MAVAQGTPIEQDWKNLSGVTAWHLIDRHADNWEEVGQMMDAWLEAKTAALSAQVVELQKDAQWAKSELLEIMRIVGSPSGDDDITRLIKLHGIRLLVEADHVKYESLLDAAAKAGS